MSLIVGKMGVQQITKWRFSPFGVVLLIKSTGEKAVVKRKVVGIVFAALLSVISGCGKEVGDHGSGREVEIMLSDGGSVTLICHEFDSRPIGHVRGCYIKKESSKLQKPNKMEKEHEKETTTRNGA